jgi:hypothetical protein
MRFNVFSLQLHLPGPPPTYQKENNDTDKKLNYTDIMKERPFRQPSDKE